MEVEVSPSQFPSVHLNDVDKEKSTKSLISKFISDSVTITPVDPNRNVTFNGQCKHSHKASKKNLRSQRSIDRWNLKKFFPQTLLEECDIEVKKFSIKESRRENITNGSSHDVELQNEKTDDTYDDIDVNDIITGVEVVYSDEDEPYSNENGVSSENGKEYDNSNLFACDYCPNKYGNKGALWQHSVAAHSVEKTCECQLCGRKFYRNCSLALHMKCHNDEQKCKCHVCGKQFVRLSLLEKHAKTHADSNIYKCKVCGKKFSDQTVFQKHTATHTEKYSCELCNVTFNRKRLLELHFDITHNRGELPFICKHCKARFGNLRELSEHNASHTSEKLRISCQHCGEFFAQRAAYKKHLQTHTGDRLRCEICRIDFTQRSSLLRHLKRLHGINSPQNGYNTTVTNGSDANNKSPASRTARKPILAKENVLRGLKKS